jgi:NmrA-like family
LGSNIGDIIGPARETDAWGHTPWSSTIWTVLPTDRIEQPMFAIFGANGKVGSATARQLRKNGFAVRAVVRELVAAEPLAEIGCELCSAELDDEGQIAQALDGIRRALIMCPPDLSASKTEPRFA